MSRKVVKITPQEFLERFKARDPEVIGIWFDFLVSLRKIREQVELQIEEQKKTLAKLAGEVDDQRWLINAGVEALNVTDLDVAHAIIQRAFDLYFMVTPNQEIETDDPERREKNNGLVHEMPIEWDTLAAASADCLTGRKKGFLEKELVSQIPGKVIWHLRHRDLGDFGTFEVRKLRAGWSQICFSGYEFIGLAGSELRQAKHKHMQQIISSYYQLLMKENIWDVQEPAALETQTSRLWQLWLHIPDQNQNRQIVQLWCQGMSVKNIAAQTALSVKTINNTIVQLRQDYPNARIPMRFNRRKDTTGY